MNGKVIGIIALVALAALLVAFGPPPKSDGDGNTLHVVATTAPDSIDSGVSYLSMSWQIQVNVYNGLLTYRKVAGDTGTELVPDLAEALPEITDGGRTITFKVRKGVKFGPPANREVLPSDIKYTFDRNALIPSQGAFYYSIIEGFDEFQKTRKGTVSGIVADDEARTITFHLTRPDTTFLYVLAMPFSYAVPKGLPPKDMSLSGFSSPTGPYRFVKYDPARGATLERNPAFKEWNPEATPNGKVDRIEIEFGVSDENSITRIMQGKADVALSAIPRSKLAYLLGSKEWKPYMHEHAISRTAYVWMNTKVAPFDNVKVRQAVNWAINRRAMVKLGGGASTPSSTILPPNMPGYTGEEAYPKADMKLARKLIAESGITPGKVTIWHTTAPPSPDMAQYLQETLSQLGFEAKTRGVDGSAFYDIVGNEKNKTQIGFGSWGADFPEGSNFIDVLFNSAHIDPHHSINLAWYGGMDKQIDAANRLMDIPARQKAWGELDLALQKDGPWAPISHGVQRNLMSKRYGNYVYHPVYDVLFSQATVDGSGTNNSKTHDFEVGSDEDSGSSDGSGGEDE
ncbi:MAG: ABC transporter substrate-binding protein [Thermoleophilia bacterium]|nr:ABC transporter substrate-binding protein [Thermoleophilia bacterium]